MTEIERLRNDLADAELAAFEAPSSSRYAENRNVNAIRAKLNAAIEEAKTPEQRQIEAMESERDLLNRRITSLEESLEVSRKDNKHLRAVIGAHTGRPTDKPAGLLAMDLSYIRKMEDDLAKFVRAGDMDAALRVCINRSLPRPPAANLSELVDKIGLPRMQA